MATNPTASSRVSIVVPAYNEEHLLVGLFDSIAQHAPRDIEVVVVDNGSVDGTSIVTAARGYKPVRLDKRVFPGRARNIGVEHCDGDVLVFLDADVELSAEWGRELRLKLDSIRAEPMQITGDLYHISKRPSWIEKVWFAPLRDKIPTYINGGNLLTTRAVFQSIGGFDARLETGEDVDFCIRAMRAGIALRVNDGFKVFHEGYPKTIRRFVKRERWHGLGDFLSVGSIFRSKVAIATLVFVFLHVCVAGALVGVLVAPSSYLTLAVVVVVLALFCLTGAVQKFPQAGPLQVLRAMPVVYFYYLGRTLSALDAAAKVLGDSKETARHR